MLNIILLFLASLFASTGAYLLKREVSSIFRWKEIINRPFFYIGCFIYAIAALVTFYLLQKMPYSLVIPLGSLTYVWTFFIAATKLGEKMTLKKINGLFFILLGSTLVML